MRNYFWILMIVFSLTACNSTKKTTNSTSTATSENSQRKANRKGAPNMEQLMQKMDANNDGKLSKVEAKGPLAKDFDTIDLNKDGFLSTEELAKAPKPKGRRGGPKN